MSDIFQTSKDVLNVSLAIWTGLLAIFLCWGLYYVIAVLRDVRKISKGVQDKMRKVDEIINKIQEKIEKTSSNIGLMTELVKRGFDGFSKMQGKWGYDSDEKILKKKKKK